MDELDGLVDLLKGGSVIGALAVAFIALLRLMSSIYAVPTAAWKDISQICREDLETCTTKLHEEVAIIGQLSTSLDRSTTAANEQNRAILANLSDLSVRFGVNWEKLDVSLNELLNHDRRK